MPSDDSVDSDDNRSKRKSRKRYLVSCGSNSNTPRRMVAKHLWRSLSHQHSALMISIGRKQRRRVSAPLITATMILLKQTPIASELSSPPECGLYLAESTLPNAGIGIFTAHSVQAGYVFEDTVDVCIPVLDLYWNTGQDEQYNNHPFKDYFWSGRFMGMGLEIHSLDIEALCPGLDCAINCHLPLVNVATSKPVYDDPSITSELAWRQNNPAVGSYTPYHNGTTLVTRDIPAGGELFKSYGDSWFTSRERIFGKQFPLTRDYPVAQKLIETLLFQVITPILDGTLESIDKSNDFLASEEKQMETILRDFYETIILSTINQGAWESRVLNALPQSLSELKLAWGLPSEKPLSRSAHDRKDQIDITRVHQQKTSRSLQDLKATGKCLDHIRPGPSRLPNAGRGAFATRDLPAGTIITASPLHHIPNKDYLNMYKLTRDNQTATGSVEWLRHVDTIVGKQLLYNYCFGHAESSLLLCPYGAGVNYINHHFDKSAVNVKLQWATNFDYMHQHDIVQNGTIADNLTHPYNDDGLPEDYNINPVLAFDYVATRDIQAGDELYLDYGPEWEAAWLSHVQKHQSMEHSDLYASAPYWNQVLLLSPGMPLRTSQEQRHDPYPAHLQIRCHSLLAKRKSLGLRPPKRYEYSWKVPSEYGYPCRILDRFLEHNEYWYTVEIERPDSKDPVQIMTGENITHYARIQRADVPREAIRFFDKPGTTDLHMPWAFRHWIGIPDRIFPKRWRNLVEQEYQQGDDTADWASRIP